MRRRHPSKEPTALAYASVLLRSLDALCTKHMHKPHACGTSQKIKLPAPCCRDLASVHEHDNSKSEVMDCKASDEECAALPDEKRLLKVVTWGTL